MKINEIITEEMVRGIYPNKIRAIAQITDKRIDYYDNQYVPNACSIDLARFLFVDAWDCFRKKNWLISIYENEKGYGNITAKKGGNTEHFLYGDEYYDYPSRLYAMAAAVAYMWEQEEKQ